MTLPDKTVYYYNGVKQNYDNLKNLLQANSTIVYANNDSKDGFEYAVIYDPVYSKPELGNKIDSIAEKIGNIDYKGGLPVIKNGQQISISEIKSKDAVYRYPISTAKMLTCLLQQTLLKEPIKAFSPPVPPRNRFR
jgi:hypothetical protein